MDKKFEIKDEERKYVIYDVKVKEISGKMFVVGKIKHGSKTAKFSYDIFEGKFDTNYKEEDYEDIYKILEKFGDKHFYETFADDKYNFYIV